MWFAWVWTVLFLALAGHCVARLVAASRACRPVGERAGDAVHALMSVGMAAMFSPVGGPIPRAGWVAVFGLAAGYAAVTAVRARERAARVAWAKHVVGGTAMVYMLVAGSIPTAASDAGHAGHLGHGAFGGDGALEPAPVTWALAAYFVGYAVWSMLAATGVRMPGGTVAMAGVPGAQTEVSRTEVSRTGAGRADAGHRGTAQPGALRPALPAPRVVASCEVVMAAGMVYMLVVAH